MSDKEILITVNYSRIVCHYYADYTFLEIDNYNEDIAGQWRVNDDNSTSYLIEDKNRNIWEYDEFSDQILDALANKILLEELC